MGKTTWQRNNQLPLERVNLWSLFWSIVIGLPIFMFIFELFDFGLELEILLSSVVFYLIIIYWMNQEFRNKKIKFKEIFGKRVERIGVFQVLMITILQVAFSVGSLLVIIYVIGKVEPDYITSFFKGDMGPTTFNSTLLSILITITLAPIVEELLFRGIIFNKMAMKWGTTAGIFLSSALFSVLHFNSDMIGHFVFGMIVTILYIRTQSLVVPIMAHMLNNLSIGIMQLLSYSSTASIPTSFELQQMALGGLIITIVAGGLLLIFFRKIFEVHDRIPYLMNKEE